MDGQNDFESPNTPTQRRFHHQSTATSMVEDQSPFQRQPPPPYSERRNVIPTMFKVHAVTLKKSKVEKIIDYAYLFMLYLGIILLTILIIISIIFSHTLYSLTK